MCFFFFFLQNLVAIVSPPSIRFIYLQDLHMEILILSTNVSTTSLAKAIP